MTSLYYHDLPMHKRKASPSKIAKDRNRGSFYESSMCFKRVRNVAFVPVTHRSSLEAHSQFGDFFYKVEIEQ